jgi:membrane-associated phospholipid phosphatase
MKTLISILVLTLRAVAQDQTAIQVKPATPVIQQKDLWDQSGVIHPFLRMPRFVLHDQGAIWTSPFHTAKSDIKWWAIFGGATAALVVADWRIADQLPNSNTQVSISTWGSRIGSAYSLIPLSAGFYFIGSGTHDEHLRETGLIAFEALIDANLISAALKLSIARARPLQGDGRGRFGDADSRWDSSFPSGHAINTWALASVIAHEYPKPLVKLIAYGFASTVVVSRVGARKHFPGDVVAGAGIGWFIGDYLYGKRHNRTLEGKRSALDHVLDHVNIGVSIQ